jgi:hypothetical protein
MGKQARSAITGRYITKKTAAKHPKTSVIETTKKRSKKQST